MFFFAYIVIRLAVLVVELYVRLAVLVIRVMVPLLIASAIVLATWVAAMLTLSAAGARAIWTAGREHRARRQIAVAAASPLDAFGNEP